MGVGVTTSEIRKRHRDATTKDFCGHRQLIDIALFTGPGIFARETIGAWRMRAMCGAGTRTLNTKTIKQYMAGDARCGSG